MPCFHIFNIRNKRPSSFHFSSFSVFLGTIFFDHVSGIKNRLRTKDSIIHKIPFVLETEFLTLFCLPRCPCYTLFSLLKSPSSSLLVDVVASFHGGFRSSHQRTAPLSLPLFYRRLIPLPIDPVNFLSPVRSSPPHYPRSHFHLCISAPLFRYFAHAAVPVTSFTLSTGSFPSAHKFKNKTKKALT